MKEIGAVTIGKLIEAHYEKDEVKFKAYAEHIADALKKQGDERGAQDASGHKKRNGRRKQRKSKVVEHGDDK